MRVCWPWADAAEQTTLKKPLEAALLAMKSEALPKIDSDRLR